MSEEKNNIDQLFKEKLSIRKFDVPAGYVSNLESMLPPEKSNGKMAWWIVGSLLFLSVAAAVYFWPSNSLLPEYQSFVEHIKIDSLKTEGFQPYANDGNSDENNGETVGVEYKTESSQMEGNSEDEVAIADNKSTKTKGTNQKSEKHSGSKEIKFLGEKESGVTANSASGKILEANDSENTKNNSNDTKNIGNQDKVGDGSSLADNSNVVTESEIDTTKKKETVVTSNSPRIRDSVVIRDSIVIRDSVVVRDSVVIRDSVVVNEKASLWELKMFGGISSVNARITNTSTLFTESLRSSETKLTSPELGLHATRVFNKLQVGVGVGYYQYGEKYNYQLTQTTLQDSISTSFIIDSILYDSIGDPYDTIFSAQYDTTQINYSSQENIVGQNSYSKISIPLSFGYRFTYRDWKFTPQVSVNLEFELSNSLKRYPNLDNSDLIESPAKRFTMSYVAQFEVRREFSSWFLFVSPFYRSSIINVIQTPVMDRKYGAFGTVMGIGVKF